MGAGDVELHEEDAAVVGVARYRWGLAVLSLLAYPRR
jgi:hypothetical protein